MTVSLVEATEADRETLSNLGQLYQYDFTEFLPEAVDRTGRFGFIPFETEYTEARYHPFLIVVGELPAGFAIVSQGGSFRGEDRVWWMDEFFVMRQHRRRGVGERAATSLFDRFGGTWEVGQVTANTPGQAFWRRVVGRYTDGAYEEFNMDDDRWVGPVQTFTTP